jgi:hypothetical protein
MQPAEEKELDLIQFFVSLLWMIKRRLLLIFAFTIAGFFTGLYLVHRNNNPFSDFYKRDFVLTSICPAEYLLFVSKSLAINLKTHSTQLYGFRKIEPKLIEQKSQKIFMLTFSAYDSASILPALSAFKQELMKHSGFQTEHQKAKAIKTELLKQIKLLSDSVCMQPDSSAEKCIDLIKKQLETEAELARADLFEINEIDATPVFVSQKGKRNLLLTGLAFTGLITGLMISFLLEFYKFPVRRKTG